MSALSTKHLAAIGIAAVAIYAFLVWWFGVSADAVSGFLGVILGGCLVALAQSFNAASERRNQMRLAAIDRRLDSYQEAFRLWRKLLAHVHKRDQIGDVVLECQDWWERNCLYLDPDARKAFNVAYMAASNHSDLLAGPRNDDSAKLIKENWKDITDAGETIVKGAALPSIGELEQRLVGSASGGKGAV